MADVHDPAPAPPEPRPPATAQPADRAAWRVVLRLLGMLVLVAALAAGAVLLLPDQFLAPLLVRAARSAAHRAGGDLTVGSLRGGLRGPWIVDRLRWRSLDETAALREASASRATIVASPWDLLAGRDGWLHEVTASGIDVRLDLAAPAAEAAPPAARASDPLRLRRVTSLLDELPVLKLDQASVHAQLSDRVLEVQPAALAVGPRTGAGREIAFDLTSLPGGADAAAGRAAAGAPTTPDRDATALRGRLLWDGRALQVNELSARGGALDGLTLSPGARIDVGGAIEGGVRFEGAFRLLEGSGVLRGQLDGGVARSHVELDDVEVGGLWRLITGSPAPPEDLPSGRLHLDGEVSVPLARPLALTGALDVEITALRAAGGTDAFDSVAGRLELAAGSPAGPASGEVRLLDVVAVQGSSRLQAEDLRLPLGVATLRDLVLQGSGRVRLLCKDVPALLAASGIGGGFRARPVPEHELVLTALLDHGVAVLEDGALTTPGGQLIVQRGRVDLSGGQLLDAPIDIDAQADFKDLSPLGPILDPLFAAPTRAAAPRWSGSLAGSVHAEGSLREPWARVDLAGDKVVAAGWPLGETALRFTADRRTLVLESLASRSRAAELQVRGRCALDSSELSDVELSLELADASRLPVDDLAGSLSLQVRASGPLRAPLASFTLESPGLTLPGITIDSLTVQAQAQGGRLEVQQLSAATSLGEVSARGALILLQDEPLRLLLEQLSTAHAGLDLALTAPIEIVHETARDGGRWRCDGAELSGSAGLLRLALGSEPAGGGTPASAALQTLVLHAEALRPVPLLALLLPGELSLDSLDGDLRLAWSGERLEASGELGVAALRCRIDGASLAPGLQDIQVAGSVVARAALAGPLAAPKGTLELSARELSLSLPGAEASHGLGRAAVTARLAVDEQGLALQELMIDAPKRIRLAAHGSVGAVPDLRALLARPRSGRVLPADAPLDLELRLSAGDLAFLAGLLSDVRRVEGVVSADVQVRGTPADPLVTGLVSVEDGELLLATGFPSLDALQARLQFAGRVATIRELRGELGGSPFEITGQVRLPEEGAALDITLRGDDLLLYRSNGVTVRADTDVSVSGPLAALAARGSVALRDSRFARNLNFLHLTPVGGPPGGGLRLFSFPEPPLSTMALDVRVTALEPLVIDNNLARGGLNPNLHVTGSGLVPIVEGAIELMPTRVALPGGTVRTTAGQVLFGAGDPFHPTLDIAAQTRMRGYDIAIGITGPFDQPLVSLSSVPPLPDDELLLLVLTGQPPGAASLPGGGARDTFAVYLGQDLLARWVGDQSGADQSGLLERFDVEISRDVSRPDVDIMRVSYRLSGLPDAENPLTFFSAEKDVYDRVNFGLQFLYRMP